MEIHDDGARLCGRARRDVALCRAPPASAPENDTLDNGSGSVNTPVSELELAAEVDDGQWGKQPNFRLSWSVILSA
jgi:hypothetical protein